MSPYRSAHDEWAIMKLYMFVGYHTANNVSNFGDDTVTQLIFLNVLKKNLSFCIPKYAQCWFNLHMRDGAIHYKLYLLKLTMAVATIVFRIIKGALCVLYNTIKWSYQPKHSPSLFLCSMNKNNACIFV